MVSISLHFKQIEDIPQEERIEILKSVYETELISKAKDMAYQIVKLRKEENPNKEKIDELLVQISETIKGITYSLDYIYFHGRIHRYMLKCFVYVRH